MEVAAYKSGVRIPIDNVANRDSVVLEVKLDDGRTIQLTFDTEGMFYLRGWGNIPARLGNSNKVVFQAAVQYEEATHCEVCFCPLEGPRKCTCKIEGTK